MTGTARLTKLLVGAALALGVLAGAAAPAVAATAQTAAHGDGTDNKSW